MKKNFLIILILILSIQISGQELNCRVIVNYEKLPINNREILANFANEIETYMNKTQFTGEPFDGEKINCTMNIFFTSASSDIEYSAQVVVTSTRPVFKSDRQSPMLTINDANWNFKYEKGQPLYSNQSIYDPITSFLDFYANIIIGFDYETWEEFLGTQYFQKAFNIANLGMNSNYKKGWERTSDSYNRTILCEDLLSDKFRPFREAFYEYHYGIDLYQVNKEEAQEHIANLVNVLNELKNKFDINSVLLRTFFDAKNGEITDLLRDYKDVNIFNKLKRIDPSHTAKYNEVLK
jgi:hypothetical protein